MASYSQRIKVSESVTRNHYRINTTSQWFNKGDENGIAIAVRSENSNFFLQLYTEASSNTFISKGDTLMFQLDNDETVFAFSKGLQVSTSGMNIPVEYHISLADLTKLYQHSVKTVSYFTAGGQCRKTEVPALHSTDIQTVCTVFFQEYLKSVNAKNTVRL